MAAAVAVSGEGCLANAAAAKAPPALAALVPLCIATPRKAATMSQARSQYNNNHEKLRKKYKNKNKNQVNVKRSKEIK